MNQGPQKGVTDPLAVSGGTPDVQALVEEYKRAWTQDPDATGRIARSEDIRYTRWAGQSWDGLKHAELMPEGERPMPYDRAPDCRVNLADGVIGKIVDTLYAAFWNARVKTAPAALGRLSAGQAAEWRQVLSWMIHGPLRGKLIKDVEFAAQVMETIGWVVLHPTWRTKSQVRLKKFKMEDLVAVAGQAPEGSLLASIPDIIGNPELEEAALELIEQFFPKATAAQARTAVEALRAGEEAELPYEAVVSNGPELSILVPWQDFILPIEGSAQPDRPRVAYVRHYLTSAALLERAKEEEWNDGFVEAVLKTKGNRSDDGTSIEQDADENMQFIEIVYAYAMGVDEAGVPSLYCTVVSPHVAVKPGGPSSEDEFGTHWLVDLGHPERPFVYLQTEVIGRRPHDARGVPDVVVTQQMEMKQQRDALYVYSQLSVTPPLQKKGTQASKLPPELGPLGIINNVGGGEWSWFPPPPGKPEIAFKLAEDRQRDAEMYFNIPRVDTHPMLWQTGQQKRAMQWLAGWAEAFWQLTVLAYQNLQPEELAEVLGRPPQLTAELVAKHRLLLWFDVRSLDPAWVESLLDNVTKLLALDSLGVVDRAKFLSIGMAYLDPTLAEEVTSDQAGAKQQVFKGVREELMAIMQGNEALYTENDPTAKVKKQFAQGILQQNPDWLSELKEGHPNFNPRKRELLEKWFKNLDQSAAQEDNKLVGRLGVKPAGEPGY